MFIFFFLGKSKEAEIKRINKELANIRSKFKGKCCSFLRHSKGLVIIVSLHCQPDEIWNPSGHVCEESRLGSLKKEATLNVCGTISWVEVLD